MGFPEGLKICHTKRFFLEFTLGLFQKSLFDMRNIYKCFNKIYFWHIFYLTMGLRVKEGGVTLGREIATQVNFCLYPPPFPFMGASPAGIRG